MPWQDKVLPWILGTVIWLIIIFPLITSMDNTSSPVSLTATPDHNIERYTSDGIRHYVTERANDDLKKNSDELGLALDMGVAELYERHLRDQCDRELEQRSDLRKQAFEQKERRALLLEQLHQFRLPNCNQLHEYLQGPRRGSEPTHHWWHGPFSWVSSSPESDAGVRREPH
eukprot:TRINITY_DN1203_c0_g2_i2.p1 TRINITY_DN1203_c0_g2~~TRINITY_DN1203_c0_g2_i2.p1  ORF type:complete len:172 (+),score=31.51 TRINITY_DN1203_c0_g2_i2:137-652(+)